MVGPIQGGLYVCPTPLPRGAPMYSTPCQSITLYFQIKYKTTNYAIPVENIEDSLI